MLRSTGNKMEMSLGARKEDRETERRWSGEDSVIKESVVRGLGAEQGGGSGPPLQTWRDLALEALSCVTK